MGKRSDLVWFRFAKPFSFKVRQSESKKIITKNIEKGRIIKIFVNVAASSYDNEEKELLNLILDSEAYEFTFKDFKERLSNYLILPKECMMSEVGDVFCAKNKTVFAVMHFGHSGWWGYTKRTLCNQQDFNYCPNCGGKLIDFPLTPEGEYHPSYFIGIFKHTRLCNPADDT